MAESFEPLVEFPEEPNAAACVFFGVLAYPARGAGLPGQAGSHFASTLQKYQYWCLRKEKGLKAFKALARDSGISPPEWSKIKGPLHRGIERVLRRTTAYALYGTSMINGFFSARAELSATIRARLAERTPQSNILPESLRRKIEAKSRPSVTAVLSSDIERWSRDFALTSGPRTARVNESQMQDRIRDLRRHAWKESVAVLHMAHALKLAVHRHGPKIGGWGERNPITALVMNGSLWVHEAIDTAEAWRLMTQADLDGGLSPSDLIQLTRENPLKTSP